MFRVAKHVDSFFLCSNFLHQVFGVSSIHCEWVRYRQHTKHL